MNNYNYIVSLTTIPSKFDYLYLTMDSIINQTMLPTKIIINIPKIYNFRMNKDEIDLDKINNFINKYSMHNCFINFLNEDYGPGTKLLGLLNSDIITSMDISNTYIILIDDDLIYKPYMIETFDEEIKSKNIEVGSFYVYNHNMIKIGQGADGFLIKLNKLDKFLNYYDIIKKLDYIKYHDDYYISYFFYLINTDIIYIKPPNDCFIYDLHDKTFTNALRELSGKYSRENLNEKLFKILMTLNNTCYFNFLKTGVLKCKKYKIILKKKNFKKFNYSY